MLQQALPAETAQMTTLDVLQTEGPAQPRCTQPVYQKPFLLICMHCMLFASVDWESVDDSFRLQLVHDLGNSGSCSLAGIFLDHAPAGSWVVVSLSSILHLQKVYGALTDCQLVCP